MKKNEREINQIKKPFNINTEIYAAALDTQEITDLLNTAIHW